MRALAWLFGSLLAGLVAFCVAGAMFFTMAMASMDGPPSSTEESYGALFYGSCAVALATPVVGFWRARAAARASVRKDGQLDPRRLQDLMAGRGARGGDWG